MSFFLYKNIKLFEDSVQCNKMSPWWIHASHFPQFHAKISFLFRLLVGFQDITNAPFRNNKCQLCSSYMPNYVSHVLFECKHLDDVRETEFSKVEVACTYAVICQNSHMCIRPLPSL